MSLLFIIHLTCLDDKLEKVGSNFLEEFEDDLKMAAKALDLDNNNDSPIGQLAKNISETFKQMAQNTIHPSEVAKVIL